MPVTETNWSGWFKTITVSWFIGGICGFTVAVVVAHYAPDVLNWFAHLW